MNNPKLENSCKNCKYFRPHYFKFKISLIPSNYGHCTAGPFRANQKRSFYFDYVCPHWEQAENEKQKQTELIEEVITDMQRKLSNILQILKIDE